MVDGVFDQGIADGRRLTWAIYSSVNRSCYSNHECNVQEVEQNTANRAPEKVDIPTAYTLAKEDTVMVHILNTDATVLTMLRI